MDCHHVFDEDGDCIRCGADLFAADLAGTQAWTARTCRLALVPDTSLPRFPEEDFDR